MANTAKSQTNIVTKSVTLNAHHTEQLANYYKMAIGLTELSEDDGDYVLGTENGHVLIEIKQTEAPADDETTGLYHLAILVPTYEDLGTILRHLIENKIPMTGASDHGYSNALYLTDPAGNGIEIYADKPEEEWDIKDDGTIAGIVEQMDAEAAIAASRETFDGMPNGTIMGHVHLHVDDLDAADDFYREVLGLGLKFNMRDQALFLASDVYHHHLGANIWKPGDLTKPEAGQPGLDHVTWTASADDLDYIEKQLDERDYDYDQAAEQLKLKDPAGITHVFVFVSD